MIVLICGLWLAQTVFWPRGGTATDLRPLFPILAALLLLSGVWFVSIMSAASGAYRGLRRGRRGTEQP